MWMRFLGKCGHELGTQLQPATFEQAGLALTIDDRPRGQNY